MRRIERSSAFKRDYKREAKGKHRSSLDGELRDVLELLANDEPLEKRYRDHRLSGSWVAYCECHLRPDFLLIYRKTDRGVLRLARLGSHANLFG